MTEATAGRLRSGVSADSALKGAAALWFVIAAGGQWLFAYYIILFYGGAAAIGDFEAWNNRLINGIIEGDLVGNIAVIVHLALAFVVTVGGPLQFIPQIRARAPVFHRWNGRLYILTAFVISIGALYMVFTRGTLGVFNANAVKINAVLILICAAMTLRYALARKFDVHHRWALRTFLVVNGVWFLRVGYGLWIILNQGAPGTTNALDGPTDIFLSFASYLVPLALLELYLFTKDRAGAFGKLAMAAGLVVLTAGTGVGIMGAAMIFWLPSL